MHPACRVQYILNSLYITKICSANRPAIAPDNFRGFDRVCWPYDTCVCCDNETCPSLLDGQTKDSFAICHQQQERRIESDVKVLPSPSTT